MIVYILIEYDSLYEEEFRGSFYSKEKLSVDEILKLLTQAGKIIRNNDIRADTIAKKIQELIGITESPHVSEVDEAYIIDFIFANEHNISPEYRWLEDIVEPEYMTKRFYTWYIPNSTWHSKRYKAEQDVRKYTPAKIGINIKEFEWSM